MTAVPVLLLRRRFLRRPALRPVVLAVACACAPAAWAQGGSTAPTVAAGFSLPAQGLAPSLRAIEQQFGLRLLLAPGAAEGQQAARVQAAQDAPQALAQALAGTGLVAVWRDSRVVSVQRAGAEVLLPPVVASATRIEASADAVPAVVSVLDAEAVARRQPRDVKDLLRYEAGVSVRSQPHQASAAFYSTGRGGNEGINIRGLEGNQVLLQVDGVRLPNAYASGPVNVGRVDYLETGAFKRVEVLRGASSSSYGSDGLAGAVSFVTKDPSDLLTLGQPTQAAVTVGYASSDRSWRVMPSFALQTEALEAMLLLSARRGHEQGNRGSVDAADASRTRPNPQDTGSDYALGKLVFKLDPRQRVKLSAEWLDRDVETRVLTMIGDPFYPTTTRVDSHERIDRQKLKAEYDYTDLRNPWLQRLSAHLFHQDAETWQYGAEQRSNTTGWNSRWRDNLYGERVTGAGVQAESNFGDVLSHRLVYGLDLSQTRVRSLKDGANLLNGATGVPAFVTNKSFPDTDYQLLGAYVQDEIGLGRLAVIPGLRLDRFSLKPDQNDPLYQLNNSEPPAQLSGSEWSPRLGATWTLAPLAQVFAQYAHGYRAPTPSQVNGGVTNLSASQPYRSIGNPDLKPETSQSFELGLRGNDGPWRYSASVFHNTFDDFIASNVRVGGSGTVADPNIFQSINLTRARIRGIELSGAWQFLPDWLASVSYAHARGESDSQGVREPLETIDPDKLVARLSYGEGQRWGGEALWTVVRRKSSSQLTPSAYDEGETPMVPGGYGVLDLAGWYHFNRHTGVSVGVYNLFDKKYFLWSDVRGLSTDVARLDMYSQVGRNLSISVKHQF